MNREERGVSPVVGAILLIAITVIVAGTISVFVLGTGTPEEQPTANIRFSGLENGVSSFDVEHHGGDSIAYSDMTLYKNGEELSGFSGDGFFEVPENNTVDGVSVVTGDKIALVHDPSDSIIAQDTV